MTTLIRTNRCIDSIETRRIYTSLDKRDRYGQGHFDSGTDCDHARRARSRVFADRKLVSREKEMNGAGV